MFSRQKAPVKSSEAGAAASIILCTPLGLCSSTSRVKTWQLMKELQQGLQKSRCSGGLESWCDAWGHFFTVVVWQSEIWKWQRAQCANTCTAPLPIIHRYSLEACFTFKNIVACKYELDAIITSQLENNNYAEQRKDYTSVRVRVRARSMEGISPVLMLT